MKFPMRSPSALFAAGLAASVLVSGPALPGESDGPTIGALGWEEAETVCEAWPAGMKAEDSRSKGLSFVSYPAAVRPFGMRGYIAIDGKTHPLRQIAYANTGGTLSIYYRTLGDYHYDVYLTLTGFSSSELKASGLTGTLTASRFGLFSQIKVSGSCNL